MQYTEEMKQFIADNVKGISNAELTKRFNEKFDVNFKISQIKSYKKNHKLSSGLTGRFEAGCISHNKGKKGLYIKGSEKGWFQKGQTPVNYRPLGSERISVYGYVEIKVADPNKWQLKHKMIWEKANGKIPKNHVVIFLDGNKLNIQLDNLKLISRAELLIMNRLNLFTEAPELTETASNIAKVINAGYKAKKEIRKKAAKNTID